MAHAALKGNHAPHHLFFGERFLEKRLGKIKQGEVGDFIAFAGKAAHKIDGAQASFRFETVELAIGHQVLCLRRHFFHF